MPDPLILSVSELVAGLARHVRSAFAEVAVEGEVSNLRRPASGHLYLTLKDADAQVRAVMWRSAAARLGFEPEDGLHVVARGSLDVYEARGDVQLVVTAMAPAGEGALQQAFEALKRRLAQEGLFDPARKRPLPALPRVVGIVTSGSGAALRDMLSILERRFPALHVVVASVRVQGDGAAAEIAGAVRAFNRLEAPDPQRPDVLVVGRGGGSIEDLWAFNEEIVARAIHASGIPVVSAVGHETDITIADLVADVRAATPSMAAELVVPTREALLARFAERLRAAEVAASGVVGRYGQRLRLVAAAMEFHAPIQRIRRLAQRTDEVAMRLDRAADGALRREGDRLRAVSGRLSALDPLRPLRSGFAVVTGATGIVRSASALAEGDAVNLRFADGSADATVRSVR